MRWLNIRRALIGAVLSGLCVATVLPVVVVLKGGGAPSILIVLALLASGSLVGLLLGLLSQYAVAISRRYF
jgi:hypothetical protein